MCLEDFKRLCMYLKKDGGVSKLKIMGGEPTVHPNFTECIDYAQSLFDSVHIFTNAINEKIETIRLRERDSVIYNVSCLPINIKESRLLLGQYGGRMFETQLSSDSNIETLKQVLLHIREIIPDGQMSIALTLNCIENIFQNKTKLIKMWNEMVDFIQNDLNINHNIDHNIPYCFFVGSPMKIQIKKSKCSLRCAGLITPSMQLQYCNQSSEILEDICQDDKFIPFEILENRLTEFYYKKMSLNLKKMCRDCIFFEKKCNGGCFMHKDTVTRSSIIRNSDLPFNAYKYN